MAKASVPADFQSIHNSDPSSAIVSVPHSSSDIADSAPAYVQGPIHPEAAYGYLRDLIDPLTIIQHCLDNKLPLVRCRLTPIERKAIRSGSIFAFKESNSALESMKRWTDGLAWSKSRVHGNFLVYKQIKKRGCMKKGSFFDGTLLYSCIEFSEMLKPDGLVKKTFAILVDGDTWHVVSTILKYEINYYYEDDVLKGLLSGPSVNFPNDRIHPKLFDQSKFKLKSYGPTRLSPSFIAFRGRQKEERKESANDSSIPLNSFLNESDVVKVPSD